MPRYKVERYTLEEGEIKADSLEDATLLLKYGYGPTMWKTVGKATTKLKRDKVIDIDDNNESRDSNQEDLLPPQEER